MILIALLIIRSIRNLRSRGAITERRKWMAVLLIICLLFLSVTVIISQTHAHTPEIAGNDGKALPGSASELRKVKLNGRDKWISIRGHDRERPVLLFLSGGPGGSQMASTRMNLAELEKDFVVVNWDQPGSGKSYLSTLGTRLTP